MPLLWPRSVVTRERSFVFQSCWKVSENSANENLNSLVLRGCRDKFVIWWHCNSIDVFVMCFFSEFYFQLGILWNFPHLDSLVLTHWKDHVIILLSKANSTNSFCMSNSSIDASFVLLLLSKVKNKLSSHFLEVPELDSVVFGCTHHSSSFGVDI